ncbi:histidine kinase [Reichenbachiella carrageenanivorans]|uniref:Histidine kinase n=1 Tax=Reichenbachiella carrageenanivorans TaxID=2979869 RepID=A0ABY6D5G6_9BACT|nr:histidine kinase [Reichenbachiella carrageenanivorans]UXX80358.1 histidine kinase [Reichenbachiella carrageenanivorans]
MKWPREKVIRWTGIPFVGLLMTFIIKDHKHEEHSFIINVLVSVLFTGTLWNGAVLIIFKLRDLMPKVSQTNKRLLITYLFVCLFMVVCPNLIRLALGISTWEEIVQFKTIFAHSEINMVAAFMVSSIYEGAYFFSKWKESFALNEQLRNQQIRTQFEVLQNQMSPHFLFNSLNTLTTLIAENPKTAIDFTQTLSEVYRYILQNKEKELVRLSEELAFSESYIFLLQMRYPENLTVHFSIEPALKNLYIAPLTLQMLIENAIKHNVISKTDPLQIDIYVEHDKDLIVKNNLQFKKTLEKSTKTGLANIRKRYQYLGHREIEVIVSQKNYMVVVPLIEMLTEVEFRKELENESIDH